MDLAGQSKATHLMTPPPPHDSLNKQLPSSELTGL